MTADRENRGLGRDGQVVGAAPRRRPGGRSARVRRAVFDAAMRTLLEDGWAGFGMETVARRAGVNKTTLYRRWATKEALATEVVLDRSSTHVPMPDTGALRSDLFALLTAVAANITSPEGSAIVRMFAGAGHQLPELHAAVRKFWSTRFALAGELVRRGVERGELPAGTDADLLIEALIAPLYLRLLVTAEPLDAGHARRVVDLVVDGARGDGEGRRPPRPATPLR